LPPPRSHPPMSWPDRFLKVFTSTHRSWLRPSSARPGFLHSPRRTVHRSLNLFALGSAFAFCVQNSSRMALLTFLRSEFRLSRNLPRAAQLAPSLYDTAIDFSAPFIHVARPWKHSYIPSPLPIRLLADLAPDNFPLLCLANPSCYHLLFPLPTLKLYA